MRHLLPLFIILSTSRSFATTPCDGVDRRLPSNEKPALESIITTQLKARELADLKSVELMQSFRLEAWGIYYVSTGVSDETFVFYAGDPRSHDYVTYWSGAATRSEEKRIRNWVLKNAPGIPRKLARCFSWYVTQGDR